MRVQISREKTIGCIGGYRRKAKKCMCMRRERRSEENMRTSKVKWEK
jgi:hypothetical protein